MKKTKKEKPTVMEEDRLWKMCRKLLVISREFDDSNYSKRKFSFNSSLSDKAEELFLMSSDEFEESEVRMKKNNLTRMKTCVAAIRTRAYMKFDRDVSKKEIFLEVIGQTTGIRKEIIDRLDKVKNEYEEKRAAVLQDLKEKKGFFPEETGKKNSRKRNKE